MAWTPASRDDLESMIARDLAAYDEDVHAEWARIRVAPERWRCSPWGDAGGGFWAVAVDDGQVLWFNDIEGGFCWSRFTERGTIAEYRCDQDDFTQILERIAQAHGARAWAGLRARDLPAALAGPGAIVRRQTSYWEARATTGALYRVHFRDELETGFADADYPDVTVHARHPLLVQYEEPSRSLYFAGTPIDPRALAERLDRAIRDGAEGWRDLSRYAGSADRVERLLRAGHGLLMDAPRTVCAAVAAALEGAGVRTSILGAAPARAGARALVLGRSYVIAGAFAYERRDAGA